MQNRSPKLKDLLESSDDNDSGRCRRLRLSKDEHVSESCLSPRNAKPRERDARPKYTENVRNYDDAKPREYKPETGC